MIFITAANAEVPGVFNYQGRLTDAAGNPVADGSYLVKFKIYGSESGDDSLWSSGFRPVQVTDGFFEYSIGSVVPLPDDIFTKDTVRYLGITVGTESETAPRKRIMSTVYAIHARMADTDSHASAADIAQQAYMADTALALKGEPYLRDADDTLRGNLYLGESDSYITVTGYGSDIFLRDSNDLRAILYGTTFGTLELYDNSANLTAVFDARVSSGGYIHLDKRDGSNDLFLDASGDGNSTVIFSTNAVDADEIFDEPGIAYNESSSSVLLDESSMEDIITVTLTIPGSGYIVLQARG